MKKILITFLLTASALSAQLKTNFEVIQNGIESSVDKLLSEINKNDEYSLEINSPNEYSSLTASIKNAFSQKINIQSSSPEKISFTVNEIHLNYNDCFRDGLFGDFYTERIVNINSTYNLEGIKNSIKGNSFSISLTDTIPLDKIDNLENNAYNFTRSEKPEEPFLSGLTEPLIAVSAIAVSIYLLFSVRSN